MTFDIIERMAENENFKWNAFWGNEEWRIPKRVWGNSAGTWYNKSYGRCKEFSDISIVNLSARKTLCLSWKYANLN